MKKKMYAAALTSVVLSLSLAVNVLATGSGFSGSKTQQSVAAVNATITTASGEKVETTIGTTTDLSGLLQDSGLSFGDTTETGEVVSIESIDTPVIKITPVQETRAANDSHDEENGELSFWDKAHNYTESGLTYSANEQTNLVYEAASYSDSTESFLNKFDGLLDRVIETIKNVITAATDGDESGDDVSDDEASVDEWTALALFDVSANQVAKDAIGEDGSVELTVELDGVHEDSKVFGLHFIGEVTDPDSVRDALENGDDSTSLDFEEVEILEVTPGEGQVTFSMKNSFSPVMIMVQETTEVAETTETTEEKTEEAFVEMEETEEAEESSSGGSMLPWITVIIIAVVLVIYFVMKRNKKDKTQDNLKDSANKK